MSDAPGTAGSGGSTAPDEQFTVPVPTIPRGPGVAAQTQSIPVFEPTRELPTAAPSWPPPPPSAASPASPASAASAARHAPAVPPNPYAAQTVWPGPSAPGAAHTADRNVFRTADRTANQTADENVDPLLGQIGIALFWITVGWWTFFLIRFLGHLTRYGLTDTILIRTIDVGAEETVIAAVLSVLAALLLLLGRGREGRSPLGWASLALAVVTVGIAVWRLLP